jgi:hypothetical protein
LNYEAKINENGNTTNKLDLTKVKAIAMELPQDSAFREIINSEKDTIDIPTFLSRLPIWLQLLRRPKN